MGFKNNNLEKFKVIFKRYFRKENEFKYNVIKIVLHTIILFLLVLTPIVSFLSKNIRAKENNERVVVETFNVDRKDIEQKYKTSQNYYSNFNESEEKIENDNKYEVNNDNISKDESKESKVELEDKTTRKSGVYGNKFYEEKEHTYPDKVIVFDESGKENVEIEEGTLIPVLLATSVVMKDTKIPVRFKVTEDIYDENGKIVVTSDSLLFGTINAFNEQGRVFGKVNKLKIIGEKIKKISADILNVDESFGIKGYFFEKRGSLIAGTLALNFLSSFAEGFKSKMAVEFGGTLAQY